MAPHCIDNNRVPLLFSPFHLHKLWHDYTITGERLRSHEGTTEVIGEIKIQITLNIFNLTIMIDVDFAVTYNDAPSLLFNIDMMDN